MPRYIFALEHILCLLIRMISRFRFTVIGEPVFVASQLMQRSNEQTGGILCDSATELECCLSTTLKCVLSTPLVVKGEETEVWEVHEKKSGERYSFYTDSDDCCVSVYANLCDSTVDLAKPQLKYHVFMDACAAVVHYINCVQAVLVQLRS
jgi:hypothetical protein